MIRHLLPLGGLPPWASSFRLDDMLAEMEKLRQEVNNAKNRLSLVEAHVYVTAEKCNTIQHENQSLWKILEDSAPHVKAMRGNVNQGAGEAASTISGTAPGAATAAAGPATGAAPGGTDADMNSGGCGVEES